MITIRQYQFVRMYSIIFLVHGHIFHFFFFFALRIPGNYPIVITDNLNLEEESFEFITTSNFLLTLSCGTTWSVWPIMTFTAPNGFRIRGLFEKFGFDKPGEYLEFGDGLTNTEEKRLARFYGTDVPSDVTSVSNSAWIKVSTPCGTNIPDLSMVIRPVRSPEGNCERRLTKIIVLCYVNLPNQNG